MHGKVGERGRHVGGRRVDVQQQVRVVDDVRNGQRVARVDPGKRVTIHDLNENKHEGMRTHKDTDTHKRRVM